MSGAAASTSPAVFSGVAASIPACCAARPDPRIPADEVFAEPYGGDGITEAVQRLAQRS